MPHHISLLKNNSENLKNMQHHLMPHYISTLKNNVKKLRKSHYPTSHFSIENNPKTLKMSYNSLGVINGELSQHASMSHHQISRQLSLMKIIMKTLEFFPKVVPQL
jgi:hypothetical protein